MLTKLTVESAELWQAEAGVGRTLGEAAATIQTGIRFTAVRDYRMRFTAIIPCFMFMGGSLSRLFKVKRLSDRH